MPFRINHAILHVIDRNGSAQLSNQELDTDSETCLQFVEKHVKKLLKHPGRKRSMFYRRIHGFWLGESICEGRAAL